MGRIDLETDAALTQLNQDELAKIPGGEFAELIGDLLALVGVAGPLAMAAGASSILLKLRKLAGASYTSNLIFVITAVRNDLKTLYERDTTMRERIEGLRADPEFVEAVAALALRAMHTSVKNRLKRLARIAVNGVKENDLDSESLDDMMRAAVELKDADILLLAELYKWHGHILSERGMNPTKWFSDIQSANRGLFSSGFLNPQQHLSYRSSYSRLEALGLIQRIPSINSLDGVGFDHYALLVEGKRFYERIREVDGDS